MAERTKIWIAEKMRKLMEKKSIEKIRVTEICRAAEIERPTFYYHFRDKYDLVAWMIFTSAYDTDIISVESAARALDNMKRDMIFYKRAYEDNSQNASWQYMLEYFVKRHRQLALAKTGADRLDTQTEYSIRLYCYGTLGMTREWLFNDNITPSRTAVEMMFASMPENLRRIYFPGGDA